MSAFSLFLATLFIPWLECMLKNCPCISSFFVLTSIFLVASFVGINVDALKATCWPLKDTVSGIIKLPFINP